MPLEVEIDRHKEQINAAVIDLNSEVQEQCNSLDIQRHAGQNIRIYHLHLNIREHRQRMKVTIDIKK